MGYCAYRIERSVELSTTGIVDAGRRDLGAFNDNVVVVWKKSELRAGCRDDKIYAEASLWSAARFEGVKKVFEDLEQVSQISRKEGRRGTTKSTVESRGLIQDRLTRRRGFGSSKQQASPTLVVCASMHEEG
jgi:hypothetical protein